MAYTRRGRVKDYPYYGYFYKQGEMDLTLPLDQREITDELVYETECDIQEVSKAANPVLIATFSIFMPFDETTEIPIRRGLKFSGTMGGLEITGLVTNVVLSQIGGLVAYVKDYDAGEETV